MVKPTICSTGSQKGVDLCARFATYLQHFLRKAYDARRVPLWKWKDHYEVGLRIGELSLGNRI